MKKKLFLGLPIVLILSSLILCSMPQLFADADGVSDNSAEDVQLPEFEFSGSILKKYNGTSDTCVIPMSVKEIGPGAFKGCNLTTVTIPSMVEKIDDQAFYDCKKLSRVTINNGVLSIGASAFGNCPSLSLVTVPATVESIGAGAFSGCPMLSSIDLHHANKNFFYNDGVLYNSDSTRLIQYLSGRRGNSYNMPFTVSEIDRYAFWGVDKLDNVRVSNNVKEIPGRAFSGAASLKRVYLPESVVKIGPYAFSGCRNLVYCGMENAAVKIDNTAFDDCYEKLVTDKGADFGGYTQSAMISEPAELPESSTSSGGVKESAAGDFKENSLDSGSKGTKGNKNKDSYKGDVNTDTEKSGRLNGRRGTYSKVFTPGEVKDYNSDDEASDVVGSSKISGGAVLIIPNGKKVSSSADNQISGNSVSHNTISDNKEYTVSETSVSGQYGFIDNL